MCRLKVGDDIWIRKDLKDGKPYGKQAWFDDMLSGCKATIKRVISDNDFMVENNDCLYTPEMVDWGKTYKAWDEKNMANDIKSFYDSVNKKECIVMPKFFDDWVKGYSIIDGDNLIYSLVSNHMESDLGSDMHNLFEDREEDCYRALLDGYEVEVEQLYTVDCGKNFGLIRGRGNRVLLVNNYNEIKTQEQELTQSEIENSEHSMLMAIAKEVCDE